MGGTSTGTTTQGQNQTQTQQTTPWAPGGNAVQSIIGQMGDLSKLSPQEQSALAGLTGSSGILSGYLPQQTNVANTLYGGGQNFAPIAQDAYNSYLSGATPIANASLNPYETPGFADALNTTRNDIYKQVADSYAAAGRDPSGAGSFAQTLGRGEMQGLAPTIAGQYNTNVQNRMGALSGMFNAGGSTAGLLSGLQQTQLGNMQAGAGAAQGAQDIGNSQFMQQLAIEAQRRGIPLSVLAQQAGIALPAAQAFGSTTGTGTNTGSSNQSQTMSGAQQFALISGGIGKLLGPAQAGVGAVKGLLG